MPSVHAVILNYRRRDNIRSIVDACLNAGCIELIHVIDQADACQQLEWIPDNSRVVVSRARNIGAGRRLSYSERLTCDLVIAIDDDLFLRAPQIAELVAQSHRDPTRVHGVWGQLILEVDGSPRLRSGIMNVDRPVDILNRAYAFTPQHACNALRIADKLGLRRDNLGPVDDILLSFGATHQPMCHNVGVLYECKTSNQPGIAVWKQPGFEHVRIATVERLRKIGCSWIAGEAY